ncbi:transcriptional adapter 2-alpha [Elysia marginata]|uniref:Transcriptional adapter 2-alpha n=1 Tax=Elysia marginata TaxID=1093978 RepID=A0AAV4ELP9_9GAST|nr:transcriptional adapter 2-alpha [Elysia marginata]
MLLNTIRKALSKIVLERIRPHVEQYLSHSQSGFRPNRSTSDVAWTHKWLAAKVNIENIAIKIAGIDMSAAFDTIKRETLLKILEDIVNEDEHRIIRFLLSNTIINTKIIGATEKKPFFSNIGTPQGDSLSPVLFTIYLEHALKEVRPVLPKPLTPLEKVLPREIAYTDDVNFVAFQDIDIEEVGKVLEKYNLQVNVDKTEFTNLSRGETIWQTTKKVGTLIGDQEDIERRKQLSSAALVKLKNVWLKGDKITKYTKLKLYKALVKIIRDYGLINIRKLHGIYKRRYGQNLSFEFFRPFMHLFPPMTFDKYLESLLYEKRLKSDIARLLEYRSNGITKLHGVKQFYMMRHRRSDTKSQRHLFSQVLGHVKDELSCQAWLARQGGVEGTTKAPAMPLTAAPRKPAPRLNIEGLPGYERLNQLEKEFCAEVRLIPEAYLDFSRILIAECYKLGSLKLAQARTLIKIDVNKTRKLFDFLVLHGHIVKGS